MPRDRGRRRSPALDLIPHHLRTLATPGPAPVARRWLRLRTGGVALAFLMPLSAIGLTLGGRMGEFNGWFWALMGLSAASGAFSLCARIGLGRLRRRVQAADGAVCPGCGYALQGLEGEFACPECGRRVSHAAARADWRRIGLL